MSKTLVIYGSLTGNTQLVAENIHNKLIEAKIDASIKNVLESTHADFETADILVLGASTWDDGLVQYDFEDFLHNLKNTKPDLIGKKLAVFGCGDSNYEHFCAAVDAIEKEVSSLGAKTIIESLRIDGPPEEGENNSKTDQWSKNLTEVISS